MEYAPPEILAQTSTFLHSMAKDKFVAIVLLVPLDETQSPITACNFTEDLGERIVFLEQWIAFLKDVKADGKFIRAEAPHIN